ncbi:MAG: hypothetical protein ACO3GU_02270 [Pelagibacteraceae bacterium]
MAAPGIDLSFGALAVRLERFNGSGAQRSYVDTASLNFSSTGAAVQSGNTRGVRRLWTVSTLADKQTAYDLQDLYEAWDQARATGAVAVVAISDEITARDPSQPLTATAVFTEAVSLELAGNGSPLYRVSFGLSEV